MANKLLCSVLVATTLILANACQTKQCKNINTILAEHEPGSNVYQRALANDIRRLGTANLSYRFEGYIHQSNQEGIAVNIQGEGLCATAVLEVTDWAKLQALRKETSGYRGAVLKGLTFKIASDAMTTRFIYDDVDTIAD